MLSNFLIASGAALACTAAAVLFGEDVQMPEPSTVIPGETETLVVIGGRVSTPNPNGKAVVRAWAELKIGDGTTDLTLAVYRGPELGGIPIATKTLQSAELTAGARARLEIECFDTFENTSDVQYSLSVQQAGATSDGQILNALLDTKVLSG